MGRPVHWSLLTTCHKTSTCTNQSNVLTNHFSIALYLIGSDRKCVLTNKVYEVISSVCTKNYKIKIRFTEVASSKEHSGCINYDKACPYDATSAPRFTVSTIGHSGNLLE